MRPRLESSAQEAGFTLTELLVSLSVLALMSLLLLQGLKASGHLWRRSLDASVVADNIQSAQELVRQRLERTYFETALDAIPAYPFFVGGDAALTFVSVPPDHNGDAELRIYTLSVTTGGDLVFSSISSLDSNPVGKPPSSRQTEVLLHGVQSLDVSYFDAGPGENRGWKPAWQKRIHPPALVRLQVNFPPGDQRWWPTLLVHPIATTDRECQVTPHSSVCAGRS